MSSQYDVINTVVVEGVPKVNFLAGNTEFSKMMKLLDKPNKQAIEVLLDVMQNSTEEKMRVMCADKITTLYANAVKDHSAEQLQKMVAHARLSGGGVTKQLVNAPSEDAPRRPTVDFSTIKEI